MKLKVVGGVADGQELDSPLQCWLRIPHDEGGGYDLYQVVRPRGRPAVLQFRGRQDPLPGISGSHQAVIPLKDKP